MTADERVHFGGDYNPEQWHEEVWAEDTRLTKEAGVSMVTAGTSSWAKVARNPNPTSGAPLEDHPGRDLRRAAALAVLPDRDG